MSMPMVSHSAPTFDGEAVIHGEVVEVTWEQLHESNWLILFFYPYDFTHVCPTEIFAFSEAQPRFQELGVKLCGISCDSVYSHFAWTRTPRQQGGLGDVRVPLISDQTREISRKYGVLLEEKGVALRGLFIIDPRGIIRHATINDLGVGRNVEETLRIVQALQHVDAHGELCPANWTPGTDGLRVDGDAARTESRP